MSIQKTPTPIALLIIGAAATFIFYVSQSIYKSNLSPFYTYSPPYSSTYEKEAAEILMFMKFGFFGGLLVLLIGVILLAVKVYMKSENKNIT